MYGPDAHFVAARNGYYFSGAGQWQSLLLFDDLPPIDARALATPQHEHFPVKQVFAEAAAHLAAEKPFELLGEKDAGAPPATDQHPARYHAGQDTRHHHAHRQLRQRRGQCSPRNFRQAGKKRPFSLYFKRHDPITRLSTNYSHVPVGEQLCLFNIAGYLKIAINMGRAASLFGLKVEDVVEIAFEEKQA